MRPSIVKAGPAKKSRSLSEKTPNWKTGISATSTFRIMRTSSLVLVLAVTASVKATARAESMISSSNVVTSAMPRAEEFPECDFDLHFDLHNEFFINMSFCFSKCLQTAKFCCLAPVSLKIIMDQFYQEDRCCYSSDF